MADYSAAHHADGASWPSGVLLNRDTVDELANAHIDVGEELHPATFPRDAFREE
jgi:hypothetical protein